MSDESLMGQNPPSVQREKWLELVPVKSCLHKDGLKFSDKKRVVLKVEQNLQFHY